MKVLVTGGAGFIGSHVVRHWLAKGAQVTVLDNLRTGHRHNIEGLDLEFIQGDIEDLETVSRAVQGADGVFHLAAMVSVPESMDYPERCLGINVQGTLNVLKAAAKAGAKKMVLSSTCAIYGNEPGIPKREDQRPSPESPYAVSKLDGEYYLRILGQAWGIETACLRYFNVFGPRQDPTSAYAAAIPIFVSKALKGEDLVVHGDGQQTRDFIFVEDVAQANALAWEKGAGVYNAGNGRRITIRELAERIVARTASSSRIVSGPERAGDVKHSQADISKLIALGFAPGKDFDTGLDLTIDYFKSLGAQS